MNINKHLIYVLVLFLFTGLITGKNNTPTTPPLNSDTLAAIIKAAHSYQEIEEYIPAITQHLEEEYQCHGHGQLPLTTAIMDMQHSNNPAMVTMSQTVKNAVLFKTADWSMTGNNALLRGCLINKHIGNNLEAFLFITEKLRNQRATVNITDAHINHARRAYKTHKNHALHESVKTDNIGLVEMLVNFGGNKSYLIYIPRPSVLGIELHKHKPNPEMVKLLLKDMDTHVCQLHHYKLIPSYDVSGKKGSIIPQITNYEVRQAKLEVEKLLQQSYARVPRIMKFSYFVGYYKDCNGLLLKKN